MLPLAAMTLALTAGVVAQSGWSATLGAESFALRDVSRTGHPADASPVSWRGTGPSLSLAHEQVGAARHHRFTIDFASAGSFKYVGPLESAPAAAGDRATRLEARYEYRRYPFRDVFAKGLDAGIGVQGIGRVLSLTRRPLGGDRRTDTDASGGVAAVAVARLHRWTPWSAEVTWVNGIAAAHERARAPDSASTISLWGGGWLTDVAVAGTVRLTSRASLATSLLWTGEGTVFTHHLSWFGRRRLVCGIVYAR